MALESWGNLKSLLDEIEKANEDKHRRELLDNLKTLMGNLSRAELKDLMGNINLEVLFTCLSSENKDQIQSTCEILKNLMNVLDAVECLHKYHESILQGFYHPVPEVPQLIIAHLTRCIEASETCLEKYPNLRIAVINQLVSEELFVAKEADKFLIKYGSMEAGKQFLLSQEAVDAFKALLNDTTLNDAKKFRVYENLTTIATISADHFNKLNESVGLMQLLITLSFNSSDLLGQINAIEIIAILVGCSHGHAALANAGVFREIKKLADNRAELPHGDILLPGIIKFIGKVGAVEVPSEELLRTVIDTLIQSGTDFPLKTVSVEALAYIGSTLNGKRNLKARSDIRQCFENVRQLIMEGPTQFRARGLDAMAILFGSDEANEDCLPHWFNILFRDVSQLFELIRLPFPELRISGLNFLAAIAHLEWAQRHYLRGAGVIEFLISREIEPVKECVYAKFRLVSIIVDSPTAAQILSPENMAQLKLYIHQGPFYAHAEASVAVGAGP